MLFSDVAEYGEFCEYRQQFFWAKVDKSGDCWVWVASLDKNGYGKFNLSAPKITSAHRYSYEVAYGPIPEGLLIDHKCHVPACVRPEHLRAVSPKQNQENRSGATKVSQSGIRGVTWHEGKWQVQVKHRGKQHYFGRYEDITEAEAVAIAGRAQLFTPETSTQYLFELN